MKENEEAGRVCELDLWPEVCGKLKRQLSLENLVLRDLFLF